MSSRCAMTTCHSIALLLLLALLCPTTAGEEPAKRVVLVVDTSSSMRTNRRMQLAQQALQLFVALSDPGDVLSIVQFDVEASAVAGC